MNAFRMTRRGFVASSGAFAASAAMPSWAGGVAVPSYYGRYLDAVAAKVASRSNEAADAFFFITDLHITSNRKRSGDLIALLSGMVPVSKTLCGGDLPCAYSKCFSTDKSSLDYALDWYRKAWIKPIESANVDLYTARGNHDFTVRYDVGSDKGSTLPALVTRDFIMGTRAVVRNAVSNAADPEAICYYFDNAAAGIRYIVADTTDSMTSVRSYWTLVEGMRHQQLEWLAGVAFATVPSGWSVVVMQHIPVAGGAARRRSAEVHAPFKELMESYQNRRAWRSKTGRTFDFSSAKGRIVLDISGHCHCERQTFQNGILHVTEPCDAAYKDYIHRSPLCGELPLKKEGTIYEQTFDVVQLDTVRNLVHFTRVGGGQDRVIHTEVSKVAVGDVCRFKAERLSGAVTWSVYDGDDIVERADPDGGSVPHFDYKTTFAKIDEEGVVKGVAPGPVMVVARDKALNKEIFPLVVS